MPEAVKTFFTFTDLLFSQEHGRSSMVSFIPSGRGPGINGVRTISDNPDGSFTIRDGYFESGDEIISLIRVFDAEGNETPHMYSAEEVRKIVYIVSTVSDYSKEDGATIFAPAAGCDFISEGGNWVEFGDDYEANVTS